jgi:hypothetical protein
MPAPRKPASRPAKPCALSLDPDAMHATIDRLKAIADASGDALLMEGPVHPRCRFARSARLRTAVGAGQSGHLERGARKLARRDAPPHQRGRREVASRSSFTAMLESERDTSLPRRVRRG